MHQSSYSVITHFKELVMKHYSNGIVKVLDVGSYGVNGTFKEIFSDKNRFNYVGLDVSAGPNVDYVPRDPYVWQELADDSFDVMISGQAFEHIEFPWLIIEEMNRTLKPNGLICIIAPSRGPEHKYPVDCWRYYPDGFRALAKWVGLEVLETKTFWGSTGFTDGSDQWGDTLCILRKPAASERPVNRGHKKIRNAHAVNSNNPLRSGKKEAYYGFARNEVIETLKKYDIVPGRVLEIGCAGGATGRNLKEKLEVSQYVGVELSPEAAEVARQYLDNVIVADIESVDLKAAHGLQYGEFDLLIALDVLEHLYDPWDALAELAQYVKDGGHVVASIPNIQNITVIRDLIKGKWEYVDAGLLDATHIRFFTLDEARKMFSGAGLTIEQTECVMNPPIDREKIKDSGNRIGDEKISINGLTRDELVHLHTYQYIVVATKAPASSINSDKGAMQNMTSDQKWPVSTSPVLARKKTIPGLVSLVILTYNQQKYTTECVESIRKHTPEAHEIIFVDNGSTDGTVSWLKTLVKEHNEYRLIENNDNRGFAKGCNQGMEAASGEFVLLLNNDVVVTEHWLSGMLDCLKSASDSGIVGPMTNNISGPQRVERADYTAMSGLDAYARQFRERNRHRRIPLRRIVGFCMLFRRTLAEEIGLLDESFGTGNFEDDDYCLRASLEGCRNMIAGDVFIHHYGSRTFIGNKIDYGSTLSGHRKIFNEKWMIAANSDLGRKLLITSAREQADELDQAGETDKAVQRLLEGIQQAPDNPDIYRTMARILIDAKRFQEGLDALKSVPGAELDDISLVLLTGYAREGLGLDKEAEECADAVLAKEPSRASALNLKGILSYKRGDRPSAEAFFRRAVEADAGYGEPYTNLGVLKWSRGEKEEGLALLEQGFVLSPCIMDIATMYHTASTEMNALARAEKLFREAQALHPRSQRIAFLLIDILLKQGRDEAAMAAIEDAMTLFTISDGLLAAALAVRDQVGAKEINKKDQQKKGSLSVSMIVKNEEQHIAKCLMSVRPVADEMIVVDTGSTDRTRDIARALGAKVFEFPWTGDFSEARNYSLTKASGNWILSLDADEIIAAKDHAALRELVEKSRPIAYKIATRNYSNEVGAQGFTSNVGDYPVEEAGLGWFPSTKARLFPNDKKIRFENPVHEFVEGSVSKAGIPIKDCPIPVHHYGRLNVEKLRVKGEAYYQLGKKKLAEKGSLDPKALFELGVQAGELKKYDEAAELFEKLVAIVPQYPLAIFNQGLAYMELLRYPEAMICSKKAYEADPGRKECALNYAHCELIVGDIDHAMKLLQDILRIVPDYAPALAILAVAHAVRGEKAAGVDIVEQLKSNRFDCTTCLHDMAEGLVLSGRYQKAMSVYELIVQTRQLRSNTRELIEKCYQESGRETGMPAEPEPAKGLNPYDRQLTKQQIDAKVHRSFVGGMWEEMGELQFAFMKERGLKPHHQFIDVGCGSFRGGIHYLQYLDEGRYHGIDINVSLVEAGKQELREAGLLRKKPQLLVNDKFEMRRFNTAFDYGIAISVFTHLPMNHIIQCLIEMRKVLKPGGFFFATFFEAPASAHLQEINHDPGGVVTTFVADPFHYSFDEFRFMAGIAHMNVTLIGDWKHPRDQRMLAFSV